MTRANAATNGDANVLGVKVSPLTLTKLLEIIEGTIERREQTTLLTANARAINLAYEQRELKRLFNGSPHVICDGFGVLWAARLLGYAIPARMTPPDWLAAVADLASRRGYTVFFLGNRPGIGERAVAQLHRQFPALRVVGVHHGYFDKSSGSEENRFVLDLINAARPNILYVGFGMPAQEYWLKENRQQLEVNVAVTVGAMLDFIAGATPRGPRWLTDHGLEWLTRLITEPRRLWRRYLLGNPLFISRVLRQRMGWLRPKGSATGNGRHTGSH
jgi:N-acetylglucosaminyldiphosphoundecaprenol N-acetyl-beta-D-mannosaminyltransferase